MSKKKKYYFIYKTTNVLTGRYYYGMHSTDDLNDGYLGSGKRLRYSIRKYGKENHQREIIEFVNSWKKLKKRESEIIDLNEVAKENCLNLMPGGKGGYSSKNFGGKEGRYRGRVNSNKVINERLKEDIEFRSYWIKQTRIGVRRYYENGGLPTFLGKNHSEETRKQMSLSHKGKQVGNKNSQFGTCWINDSNIEKKIKKEDLDIYLNQGWNKGRINTERFAV